MANPEVVIVDDAGTEHVFPPGFDPKQAAAIVRGQGTAAPQSKLDWLLSQVGDAGRGVKAGAASTVFHGGDLIRRGFGMERVIDRPEVKAGITPPQTTAGKLGYLAEQVGEFAVPLSKVSKATKGMSLLTRMGAEAAAGGGVSAIQSGGAPVETAIGAVAGGASPAIAQGLKSGAKQVFRGYLKPSLAAKNAPKAERIVKTSLEEGLPISRAGATIDEAGKIGGKAGSQIDALKAEVEQEVKNATGSVDLKRIADRVRRVAKQRFYKPGADPADYEAALAVADRIDKYGAKTLSQHVSVETANETKQALQQAARNSYGVPGASAKKDMEKAGARKLRIAVEANTGGRTGKVAQLNAREAKLISSAKAIARAVEREANQNPLYGVKTMASSTLGAAGYASGVGAPAAAVGALVTRLALQPAVASRAAIVANRIARELGVTAAVAAQLAVKVVSEQSNQNE